MTDLFEPAFLERQQAVYPGLDVRVYAAAVREMATHSPVRNANGLLVHWLARADRKARAQRSRNAQAELAEMERYAALWASLLGLTATRALSPAQVASCLETARREGYRKLNPQIAARLRTLGSWPAPT